MIQPNPIHTAKINFGCKCTIIESDIALKLKIAWYLKHSICHSCPSAEINSSSSTIFRQPAQTDSDGSQSSAT